MQTEIEAKENANIVIVSVRWNVTVSSRLVRIAESWERFGPFMVKEMKNPEGSCQFTKWASLSSLPHSHSSAGMDTAPSRFHLLLWLSTSNVPYIYVSECVWERVREREGKETRRETDRCRGRRCMVVRVRALQWFLGIDVSQRITYCDLCYFCWR